MLRSVSSFKRADDRGASRSETARPRRARSCQFGADPGTPSPNLSGPGCLRELATRKDYSAPFRQVVNSRASAPDRAHGVREFVATAVTGSSGLCLPSRPAGLEGWCENSVAVDGDEGDLVAGGKFAGLGVVGGVGHDQRSDPGGQQGVPGVGGGEGAVFDGLVDADADVLFAVNLDLDDGPVGQVVGEHDVDVPLPPASSQQHKGRPGASVRKPRI